MRVRAAAGLAFWMIAVGAACNTPYVNGPCETFGGSCLTSTVQCGESLPYACNVGVCCVSNGLAPNGSATGPGPTATTTAPTSTPDATAPEGDAGPDSTVPQDSGTTSAPDSTVVGPDATGVETMDTSVPDAEMPDTEAPDTGVADTNVPDTNVADTSVADTGTVPDGGSIPTTCAQADGVTGCCGPNGMNYYCTATGTTVMSSTCASGKVCGWNTTKGYYGCVTGTTSMPDPSGIYPLACQ